MLPLNKKVSPRYVARPKVAPLSVLPIFYNLKGREVLIVGDSEGVVWKTELLLAAGARVVLFSENPHEALEEIINNPGYDLIHHKEKWTVTSFINKSLALGDFETHSDALLFADISRSNGVPVNIIDQPKFCDFQFGSIVNRSPVIVSISTTGAAPILAQTIRTRIETMLPLSIADWAVHAKVFRQKLAVKFPDLKSRKHIWREFANTAFSEPADKIDDFFRSVLNTQRHSKSGKVTLVGAGPGDSELLTIKAVRALQSADVILFDKLVSDDVLELARREARRMLVGKRGGQASCRQDDINALMVKLAKQGKHVVRLKSGDPMIFGRAGEEISILEREGIETEIVPGVTAALAAASSLGISLTHRDCAQSVKFITAHSRKGELPELDWRACADEQTTLMVYMGARTAPKLAKALMAQGLEATVPVVIAKGISRREEDISYHYLSDILDMTVNREQPVLMGIGHVFSERLAAFQNQEINTTELGDLRVLTG